MFLAWFTFDLERPPMKAMLKHNWGIQGIVGLPRPEIMLEDRAVMDITVTSGGGFRFTSCLLSRTPRTAA